MSLQKLNAAFGQGSVEIHIEKMINKMKLLSLTHSCNRVTEVLTER